MSEPFSTGEVKRGCAWNLTGSSSLGEASTPWHGRTWRPRGRKQGILKAERNVEYRSRNVECRGHKTTESSPRNSIFGVLCSIFCSSFGVSRFLRAPAATCADGCARLLAVVRMLEDFATAPQRMESQA